MKAKSKSANEALANRAKTKGLPHRFQPGESGNPSGRPSLTPEQKQAHNELVTACREHTKDALQTILRIMQGSRPSLQLQAAEYIIDRGWGKATQLTELTGKEGGPVSLHVTIELQAPGKAPKVING